jgi:hypothetical protein
LLLKLQHSLLLSLLEESRIMSLSSTRGNDVQRVLFADESVWSPQENGMSEL